MKKILFYSTFILVAVISSVTGRAQNSAGSCWYLDYDLWKAAEYPDIHGNCGSSSVFNTGEKLTMEVWVRSYTFGLNMKILGRTPASFAQGYIMGFENMHPYSEIFNPDLQKVATSGSGPMPEDSAWVHLATTYSATGEMKNYVNGELVGSTSIFPQNPVSDTDEPFIIGRAPWDYAWAFNGGIDEIRIWNKEQSQAEIKSLMFKELKGDEEGLVAYYNFNTPNGENFYDKTSNGNDGVINNYEQDCFWWAESFAPVGDEKMYDMLDVTAAWFGKSSQNYTYAVSESGLSIIAGGIGEKQFKKYIVFGHDGQTGLSDSNLPAEAPDDFMRTGRTWYVNKGGRFGSQCIFDLGKAAGGGEELTGGAENIYYTLLYRASETENFQALHCANEVEGKYVIFNDIQFSDGYYAIGYGSTQLAEPALETATLTNVEISLYPNPSNGKIYLDNAAGLNFALYDINGKNLFSEFINSEKQFFDLSNFPKGVYIAVLKNKKESFSKKIVLW